MSTGPKSRVLDAVRNGNATKAAIAQATRLDLDQIDNALKRLIQEGAVRRKFDGGYVSVSGSCLLSDYW